MISLMRYLWSYYRDFLSHPEYRGPAFHWLVPAGIAWRMWRTTR